MLNTLRFDMVPSFEHFNDVTDQRVVDMQLFILISVPWAGTGMWVKTMDIPIWSVRMSILAHLIGISVVFTNVIL